MGDFEAAVKQLGLLVCPRCGEMRQLEQIGSVLWLCDTCSRTWAVAGVRSLSIPETQPPATSLFKVLPR